MIDFEKLLRPIRDDSPTGDDLRYLEGDLTFQTIEELRAEEDPALAFEGEPKTANWSGVVRASEEALTTKTKDLELSAFLAEGLAHTEGFAGVRDGIRLTKELLHTFWDRVHPGLDEGEVILPVRAKPLNWLGSANCFVRAVKQVAFVTGHTQRPLSWADLETSERVDAAQVQSDPTQFEELTNAGNVSGETWRLALSNTSQSDLEGTLSTLQECIAEVRELGAACDERFGDEAPSLIGLEEALDQIRDRVAQQIQPEEQESAVDGGGAISGASAAPAVAAGPIATREEALRTLGLVADYFRRTEPHSPISYLVQRAVRWGSMPLEALLREVVKNDDALSRIWETLGISGDGSQD